MYKINQTSKIYQPTYIKEQILGQSSAVRTNVLPEVKKVVDKISPDYDSITQYKTDIVKWLSPIIDLKDYHVYPMNGCTEGLNWWYNNEDRGVKIIQGDYQWITPKIGSTNVRYISMPSSIDGNFRLLPNDLPIALDLAYVGSTKIKSISKKHNIEYVFFSLSKSFGVRNIRTGWLFTKKPQKKLEDLVYGAKYYNYYAVSIGETIINNFDIDFVYNRLFKEQKEVCQIMRFNPSDSVWLANTNNIDYAKFMRDGKNARLCLAGVYNEKEQST